MIDYYFTDLSVHKLTKFKDWSALKFDPETDLHLKPLDKTDKNKRN